MSKTILKALAGVAALAAVAAGASAIAGASGPKQETAGSPGFAAGGMPGYPAPYGMPRGGRGRFPRGGPPPAPVTGATADKVKAAALAKYPGSKVERIDKLPDGSYIAHVLKSDGSEIHVTVSKDFQVTGTAEERGFGPPGGHPGGRMPPPPPGSNGRPMRPQAGPPPAPPGGSNS